MNRLRRVTRRVTTSPQQNEQRLGVEAGEEEINVNRPRRDTYSPQQNEQRLGVEAGEEKSAVALLDNPPIYQQQGQLIEQSLLAISHQRISGSKRKVTENNSTTFGFIILQ